MPVPLVCEHSSEERSKYMRERRRDYKLGPISLLGFLAKLISGVEDTLVDISMRPPRICLFINVSSETLPDEKNKA